MANEEESDGRIFSGGILEILPDGRAFPRFAEESRPLAKYTSAVDDIRVPQWLVEKFHLKAGDTVSGPVRPPGRAETHFTLIEIDQVNSEPPGSGSDF